MWFGSSCHFWTHHPSRCFLMRHQTTTVWLVNVVKWAWLAPKRQNAGFSTEIVHRRIVSRDSRLTHRVKHRNAERGSLRRGERLGWRYHDDKSSNFSPPRENPQVSAFYVTASLLSHARWAFTADTKGKDQLVWSYQWAPCVLPRRPPHIKSGITRSCVSPIGCDTLPWHPPYLGASWGSTHHRRAEGTDLATKLPSSQSNQAFMGCHGSNTPLPPSPLEH